MPQKQATKPSAKLDYVSAMLSELRTIAEAEQCGMLSYLIGMAEVEAADIVRGTRPGRLGPEHTRQSPE